MSFIEGTRRTGILLGIAGGILGGVLAYSQGQSLWNARAAHLKFESLMATPTMQSVAKSVQPPVSKYGGIPVDVELQPSGPCSPQPQPNKFGDMPVEDHTSAPALQHGPWEKYGKVICTEDGSGGLDFLKVNPLLMGNRDGISKVHLDVGRTVSSIELTTGESVLRTGPPHRRAYFLLLVYPALGFLLPWGCIRLLTWVGTGFVAPRK